MQYFYFLIIHIMQTDILLKQLYSSLEQLKITIDKFEKHSSPSTQYAEQLHIAMHQCNKLVSAYLVIKEQKDLSPDLNLHLKLMNVPTPEEKSAIIEPIIATVVEPIAVKQEIASIEIVNEPRTEKMKEVVLEKNQPQEINSTSMSKEFPKIAININDKFRFINELFDANVNEYNIAIEQINAVSSLIEMNNYLKGLKSIYQWKEDNEVVRNLYALAQKRFS